MNYQRQYEYRLAGVEQAVRQKVWNEIAAHLYRAMGEPQVVLDPAAGRGEFINAIPAKERWGVDAVEYPSAFFHNPAVKRVVSDVLEADLPEAHFDGVFVSNFLEHLPTPAAVAQFLSRMHRALKPGGRIAVMGPNFKYCAAEYFDCADHTLALSHVAVEEHLYAAGFGIEKATPRFLPYSFRGVLPPSPLLTRMYLQMPWTWRFLGKQFLVLGRK